MSRFLVVLLLLLSGVSTGCNTEASMEKPLNGSFDQAPAQQPLVLPNEKIPFTPQVVATNLDVPWEMAFSPDGRIFFTQRPGTIKVIQAGKVLPQPVISFPSPFVSEGEGGLLGLALDPDFAQNHYMYAYHSYIDQGIIYNRVLRLREQNNRSSIDKVLLDRIPGSTIHNGGRLKIGPDQRLYITTGDSGNSGLAQNLSSLAGKILRLNLDGTIPEDNPFPNSQVYSYGHRNPQGLAWSNRTGNLYSSEHGSQAHDEINLIKAGANYGWPIIRGTEKRPGMESPLVESGTTTWAPSGMTFASKGVWQDQLLVGNLRGEQVLKIQFVSGKEPSIQSIHSFYQDTLGRIRDVVEGPDGSLYLLTNNRDGRGQIMQGDDKIIRLVPER
ncbi:PQQ-dependent sugar dehydrogenase [Brevibacillus sp. SYSU BS000544]|uniref:PQQ-dependent sugar dehydrogenase n=1 Tax=Brevibacillus sp. SYSU BS000544 TaxID=3416443 RepID=UPI003CE58B89